jgi:hypothetical protein
MAMMSFMTALPQNGRRSQANTAAEPQRFGSLAPGDAHVGLLQAFERDENSGIRLRATRFGGQVRGGGH